jgi:pimeloyl-ACP methyl ester carboxylesterase
MKMQLNGIFKNVLFKSALGLIAVIMFAVTFATPAFASKTLPTQIPSPPPLNWQPCPDAPTRDCANLTVPLDYADLSKGTIDLPVVRAQATDVANKIGPLVFNPGGPGIAPVRTIKTANLATRFSPEIASRFDIIAFNPRGTTAGINCFTSNEHIREYWESNHLPRTTTEINHILGLERTFNQACHDNNQPIVGHVDTASTVRDMEQLRRAMSVDKFSYMGQSYGTFIGNRYAKLYPGHLRAMVLDAVVDRSVSDAQSFAESSIAYDHAWKQFKNWCQATTTCRLRNQNIDAILDGLLTQARTNPIPAPHNPLGNHPVNDWELTLTIQQTVAPGSVTFAWVDEIISKARIGDASLASLIYDSATGYNPATNSYTSNGTRRSITCVDTEWSQKLTNASEVRALAHITKAITPRFGEANVYQGPVQCVGWQVEPVETPPVPLTTSGGFPTLIVGATKDASTPFLWSARATSKIDDSRLLTRDGDGHISLGKSRCVTAAINDALINLTLTPKGKVCPTDPDLYPPQPFPVLGPTSQLQIQTESDPQRSVTNVLESTL